MATTGREIFNPKRWAAPSHWPNQNPAAQVWTDTFVWAVLKAVFHKTTYKPSVASTPDGIALCAEVLKHHELLGLTSAVGGEAISKLLGKPFEVALEADRRRTEIFLEELEWVLMPKLGSTLMMPLEAYSTRKFYEGFLQKSNPRLIHALTIWVPTMPNREEVIAILKEGMYVERKSDDERIWLFKKVTQNIDHYIKLKSKLWDSTENWFTDYERSMWDRALEEEGTLGKRAETMDLFVLTMRHYAIDSLCNSAAHLLDMAMILERLGDGFDWVRIQEARNLYKKPYWIDAAFAGLEIFAKKTGAKFEFPDWVKKLQEESRSGFWGPFVESRLNFSSPEAHIGEFSRAYVKLCGTEQN